MERKKVLPLYPSALSTYNQSAIVSSIILENEQAWIWHYNFCLQVKINTVYGTLVFEHYDKTFPASCPWLKTSIIPRELVKNWNTFEDFLLYCINEEFYISFYADWYFIPKSPLYQKDHNSHYMSINGYDLDKGVFYVSDNFQDGKYMTIECPISSIEEAYWDIHNSYGNRDIYLLKKQNFDNAALDVRRFGMTLNNYINSFMTCSNNLNTVYGFNALYYILNKLKEINISDYEQIDKRPFHFNWEHKVLMRKRLTYMLDNGFINNKHFLDSYTDIENKTLVCRNLILKYNNTYDEKTYNKIVTLFENIIETEKIVAHELLKHLLSIHGFSLN